MVLKPRTTGSRYPQQESTDLETCSSVQYQPKGRSRPNRIDQRKKQQMRPQERLQDQCRDHETKIRRCSPTAGEEKAPVIPKPTGCMKKTTISIRQRPKSHPAETSVSDSDCSKFKRPMIYKPVRRVLSKASGDRYADNFRDQLEEDQRCGVERDHKEDCSLKRSKKKVHCKRKKVYSPRRVLTEDQCLQTGYAVEQATAQTDHCSNANKECQAGHGSEDMQHKPVQVKCFTSESQQCEILKELKVQPPCLIQTHQTHCNGRDNEREPGSSCGTPKTVTQCNPGVSGHSFPFVGKSPSGNLKIKPEMISFENKAISVLVADPSQIKLSHREWCENPSNEYCKDQTHCHSQNPHSRLKGSIVERVLEQGACTSNRTSHPQTEFENCENLIQNKNECTTVPHGQHENSHNKPPGCLQVLKHNRLTQCNRKESNHTFNEETNDVNHYRQHQRDYGQEFIAWDSPLPLNTSKHRNHADINWENNTTKGYTGYEKPSRQPSELNHSTKSPSEAKPPKIPHFPENVSHAASTIGPPTPGGSETDGEGHSVYSSNAESLRFKGSRGAPEFMENLHYRVKRAIHPDTKVVIGQREFPVHSIALQICSKYFDNLNRPQDTIHKVELPESIVSPEDFQHLMDWILTDEHDKRSVFTRDNVVGLYAAAQYLGIQELKAQCLKYVQEKVDSEDPKLIKLWEAAHDKPKTRDLIAILSQKLTALFPKLYKTRQFLKLDVNELVMLLDSDVVVIDSEMDIFDAAVRWLLYDWMNRKRYTVKVMSTIRFGLLSPLQLTQMRYLTEDKDAPAFKRIFSFDTVKKMLEDGMTFSILKQSYGDDSRALEKWIEKTGASPPRRRVNLDTEHENEQRMPEREVAFNDDGGELATDPYRDGLNAAGKLAYQFKNQMQSDNFIKRKLQGLVEQYDQPMNPTKSKSHKDQMGSNYDDVPEEKDSMFLLPDIPYADEPSSNKLHDDDSGEIEDLHKTKNQIQAAITIQRVYRGHLARKRLQTMISAAIRIQTAYRLYRERRRNNYRPLKEKRSVRPLAQPKSRYALEPKHFMRNMDLPKAAVLIFGGIDPKESVGPDNTGQDVFMYTVDTDLWMKVGAIPEPRTQFGIVRINHDVYIVGGTDPRYKTSKERNLVVNSVWKVNLRQGEWYADSNYPMDLPTPRSHFGCVSKDGMLYLIGGNDEETHATSTCMKYDTLYNIWLPIAPLDGPRTCMGATLYQNHIWVAGGLTKETQLPVLKSVLCYDIESNSWTAVQSMSLPRAFGNLIAAEDRLYIVAGAGPRSRRDDKQTSLPTVQRYDPRTKSWTDVGVLTRARHGHASALMDQQIIVFGGVNSGRKSALSSVEIFDLTNFHSHKGRRLPQKLSGMGVLPLD